MLVKIHCTTNHKLYEFSNLRNWNCSIRIRGCLNSAGPNIFFASGLLMDLRSRTAKPLDNIAESSRKLPLEKRNSLGFGGPMKLNDPETREPFHLDNLIRSDVPKSPGEFKKFLMELFEVPEEKRINSLRKVCSVVEPFLTHFSW
jgi:hypothetical protein